MVADVATRCGPIVTTETSTTGALVALVEGPTTDPAGHGASLWSYRTTDGHTGGTWAV